MSTLECRIDNYMRTPADLLQRAADAGAALLPICRDDDAAAGGVVLRLAALGYDQTVAEGFVCVRTGQPGAALYFAEA
jgi:hypothetical protein